MLGSTVKHVAQRKHKISEEKGMVINEEIYKLKNVEFITEVKYPT